jgi:K+-sensing histidine kinase KdpD
MKSRIVTARLLGLGAPLLIALALVPLRASLANAAGALVLVAVVVAVATFGDRKAGVLATLSAAAWFDFFLTRPYERFTISSSHDIETTLALIIVGFSVTEIAVHSRRLYTVAMHEGQYLAALRELSDLVASGSPIETVISETTRELRDVLAASRCNFESDVSASAPASIPRLERTGEVELAGKRFDAAGGGLPAGEIEIPVQGRGRVYGRFVFETPGGRLSIEQRITAIALADQLGAALVGTAEPA